MCHIAQNRLQRLQHRLQNRICNGSKLPRPVQVGLEYFFGHDFSSVRIHQGPEAAMLGAQAFSLGNDIYFAEGMYDPWGISGQMLLAHELAHVVQQREGRIKKYS